MSQWHGRTSFTFAMRRVVWLMILPLVLRDLAPQSGSGGRSPVTLGETIRTEGSRMMKL